MKLRNKESKIANENFIDYRHKIGGVVDVFYAILSGGFQELANTSIAQERLLNFRSISSRGERTTIGRPLGLA